MGNEDCRPTGSVHFITSSGASPTLVRLVSVFVVSFHSLGRPEQGLS